jgi:uncharacterized protein DUF2325
MAPNLAHMLSTSVLRPAPIEARLARSGLIHKAAPDLLPKAEPEERRAEDRTAPTLRRTRIWEFDTSLHCSIIGTCLTTTELRHVMERLKVGGVAAASDHELHSLGVMLASRRQDGARFLQKALDRRHQAVINRYARAKDAAAVVALWEESLRQGDVPGAYWAALTHPATTEDVVKRVFGDVHMLSHLVGAANRADIRRLRQLEQDNAALAAKVERQQRQLRDGFTVRDQTIRQLNEMVAREAGDRPEPPSSTDGIEGVDTLIADLNRRLLRETARRERSERRVNELAATLRDAERALQDGRREWEATRQELALAERHLAALAEPEAPGLGEGLDLSGLTLLYVGGRANQVPRLKDLVERAGAQFLHHDGGIEQSAGLLPGLVTRADHVLFPIDCISHDAAGSIKRLCRATGTTYAPLRTASLTCLLSALVTTFGYRANVAAE